jgi:hypothetical protein
MMKQILAVIFLVLTLNGFTQEARQWINGFIAFGSNDLFNWRKEIGSGSNNGKGYNAFGISFTWERSKHFAFETGLTYTKYRFESAPMFYPGNDMTPVPFTISVLTVPVYLKCTFLKFFYTSGGLSVNTDVGGGYQSSVGFDLGIGASVTFSNKFRVFVSPYVHNLFEARFSGNNSTDHLMETGWRIGAGYRL